MNVMHDGWFNMYTFSIKEKYIVLASKRDEAIAKRKSKNMLFLS